MKIEIKHRFTVAVIFALECGSLKLCVAAAVKENANLRGANLRGANLGDVDLRDANLRGADLRDANLVAHIGQPNGWFAWTYWDTKAKVQRVQVGCRNFTIAEGRGYWANKPNRREVLAALDFAEATARIRGWGAP